MSFNQQVTPKTILAAIAEVKRRRSQSIMEELERLEPDLAEHLFESLTTLHHRLLNTGVSPRETRGIYHEARSLIFVLILALRHAHQERWEKACQRMPFKGTVSAAPPRPTQSSPSGESHADNEDKEPHE